jgi:hypothetical protein
MARLAVGASGAAYASHKQSRSRRLPGNVKGPQQPTAETLQQNANDRRDLEHNRVSVENHGFGFHCRGFFWQKVIDNGGTNTFLPTQDFHSGVRDDFLATPDGVQKKVRVIE